jgi:hypothetical protein
MQVHANAAPPQAGRQAPGDAAGMAFARGIENQDARYGAIMEAG